MNLFESPTYCPVCASYLAVRGSFLYCDNANCQAKSNGSLKVWVSRLGILNWGDSLIDSLTKGDTPVINDVFEVYDLSVDELAMHCSGLKFAKKCYDELHKTKVMSLETLLSCLNIPNLGISTSTDIVHSGFDTIEKILEMTQDDLSKIPNIGKSTAEKLFYGIQSKSPTIIGLSSRLTIAKRSEGALNGMSFCITGSTNTPRKSLQKLISENGGIVKESVVSGLSFLITNEAGTSFTSDKLKKADKFGVRIISESQFLGMV